MNKVMLLGHVGGNAELKEFDDNSVMNFSLATNRKWKDKAGKPQESTEWHKVAMWGERAEKLAQYITKGKMLLVEGEIRTRTYEKDDETKYFVEIVANNIEFAGGARTDADDAPPAKTNGKPKSGKSSKESRVPF